MRILLDPTHDDFTTLEIDGRVLKFPHAKRDCGAKMIPKLAQLKISAVDELRIVVGPGNFTATRTVCLVGNAVKFLANCHLFARRKDEVKFKKVLNMQPFYATAPSITISKK